MQLKQDKNTSSKALLSAVLLTGFFILLAAWNANYEKLLSDFQESLNANDLGFSHFPVLNEHTASIPEIVDGKLHGFPDRPELETIFIDVNPQNYRVLLNDRETAIKANVLVDPREVNAKIRYNGNQMRADIRLKGDMNDHWLSKTRMSFRIKLKNDNSVSGFNEFSLQKPGSRQHPFDSLFQTFMRNSGNLASVHQYVHVEFNGKPWGIMIMEEAMTSEYLEKQHRKESLIIRFSNEDKGVIEEQTSQQEIPFYKDYRLSDDRLYLKMYEESKYAQDQQFRKWYSHIAQLRASGLEVENGLYDIDAYGKALFVTSIWNEAHPLWHANLRHYFNPYTLKLEPITTDGTIPLSIRTYEMLFPRRMVAPETNTPMETNSIFNKVIATKAFQENTENYFLAAIDAYADAEAQYHKFHSYFPFDVYQDNFAYLLNDNAQYLAPPPNRKRLFIPRPLEINMEPALPDSEQISTLSDHVHIRHFDNGRVDIYNLLPDQVHLKTLIVDDVLEIPLNLELEAYQPGLYEPLSIQTELTGLLDNRLQISTEYQGQMRNTLAELTLLTQNLVNPLLKVTSLQDAAFLSYENGLWNFPSGSLEITTPLVLEGNVIIPQGTTLRFSEDAYLIVKGAMFINGRSEEPVIFDAIEDSWKGIYVMEAEEQSVWNNVVVRNYSATSDGLLNLTGGVTFYKSDILMNQVEFEGAQGEDALNLVNSAFEIQNSTISNTVSDGLDSDFSEGSISTSTFSNINGDALDFSGSLVDMNNIAAENIYDKAVSVGEASTVTVEGGRFSDIGVGIVSKDGSWASARDLEIEDYALAAAMSYQKKSFYNTATLLLENIRVADESAFVRQTDSQMILDKRPVLESDVDVDFLYENTVMKK